MNETHERDALVDELAKALDAMLGQLPPQVWVNFRNNGERRVAVMQLPGELGRRNRYVRGTGATRMEALANAVAAARGGQSDAS